MKYTLSCFFPHVESRFPSLQQKCRHAAACSVIGQSSLRFVPFVTQSLKWQGQIVVAPRRAPLTTISRSMLTHPTECQLQYIITPVYWYGDPVFRCPDRVWAHFSSSPRGKSFLPGRLSPTHLLRLHFFAYTEVCYSSCSWWTRHPGLWTIAFAFLCSDLLADLSHMLLQSTRSLATTLRSSLHSFSRCLNYGQRWWYGWHGCILDTLIRHRCPADALGPYTRALIC